MDLISTRTAANAITPEEKPAPKYGERLLDFYAKKSESWGDEYKDPERIAQDAYSKASDKGVMDYDTWKSYHGVNDFIAKAPEAVAQYKEKQAFDAAQPEDRGFISGSAAALGRGVMNTVGAAGQAVGLADLEPASIDTNKGYLDRMGEGMTKWAEDKKANTQFMRPTKEEDSGEVGTIKKGWEGALESLPLTGGVAASAAAGAGIGSLAGPVGTAVGATVGGLVGMAGLFGAGTYGDSYDRTYKELKEKRPDATEDEVRAIAQKGALIDAGLETGSELVSDLAAVMMFGGSKLVTQPLTKTLKEIVKPGFKTYLLNTAKHMPFEVGSEVATAYGQADWREKEGLEGGDRIAAMGDAVLPAIFMSAVLGTAVAGYREVTARKTLSALNAEDPNVRVKAVEDVAGRIMENTEDKEIAQKWIDLATERIASGEKFDIDQTVTEWAATKTREDAQAEGRKLATDFDPKDIASEGIRASLNPKSEAEKLLVGDEDVTPEELLLGKTETAGNRPSAEDNLSTVPESKTVATAPNPNWLEQEEAAWQREQDELAGVTEDLDAQWANRVDERDTAAETRILDAEWDTRQRIQELTAEIKELESGRGRKTKKRMEAARVAKQERKRLTDTLAQGQNVGTSPQVPTSPQAAGNIPAEPVQNMQELPDRGTASPALTDTMVAAQTPNLAAEAQDREETRAIRNRMAEAQRRVANLEKLGSRMSPVQAQNLDKARTDLQAAQDELDAMNRAGASDVAAQAEERGVEEFAPAGVADQSLAASRVDDQNEGEVRGKSADLPGAGTVTAPVQAEARAKEPWQMTGAEALAFGKSVNEKYKARNRIANTLRSQTGAYQDSEEYKAADRDLAETRRNVIEKLGIAADNYNGGRGLDSQQKAERLSDAQIRAYHKRAVQKALSEGKPVPPDVLAEYPDLAPPTLPADQRTQEQAVGMASPGQRPIVDEQFDTMVKDAARWQGAARNLARELKDDKRASVRLSKITTKGDLDAYLMRKYGIDAAEARSVSNHLTARDIKPDFTATVEEFKDEPWAKEMRKEKPTQEPITTKSQDNVADNREFRAGNQGIGDQRDKHFIALIKSKAAQNKGNGIYYFDEKFMTPARVERLQTERDKKDIGKRVTRTDSFEFKHWSEVTGDRLARGYAILDRRERNAERQNQGAANEEERKAEAQTVLGPQGVETPPVKSDATKTDFTAEIEKIYRVLHLGPEAILGADDKSKFRNTQGEGKALLNAYKKLYKWSDEFTRDVWQKASKDMLGPNAERVSTEPVRYTETPSPEWVQVNRDKTVEANIPEAQKEKLTLKQQKEWLLVEIDKAIASGRTTGKPFEFHVPGDGHHRVHAANLAEFKKRVVERFPERERPSALGKNPPRPVQSQKGRIAEGEYYNEWQDYEVKLDAIFKPEEKDSPFPAWDAKTNVLHNGTSLIVLAKKPMLKGLKESRADTESFLKHSAKEISERAEIVGQFKRMGLDDDAEHRRLTGNKKTREMLNAQAESLGVVFAHVRYGNKNAFFPADMVDMLRTQYPNAELRVSKNSVQLGFFEHGKVVGVTMGFEGVELSDYHKARIEEIAAAKEGRTPKVKAADAPVEIAPLTKEEQEGVDLLVSLAKGEAPKQEVNAIDRREKALSDLDALRPNIMDDKRLTASPNVVLMNVRDMQEQEVTKLAAPYDGTREGAIRVAKLVRLHAAEEYDASMRQSEMFGTDENGDPAYAFRQGWGGELDVTDIPMAEKRAEPKAIDAEVIAPKSDAEQAKDFARANIDNARRAYERWNEIRDEHNKDERQARRDASRYIRDTLAATGIEPTLADVAQRFKMTEDEAYSLMQFDGKDSWKSGGPARSGVEQHGDKVLSALGLVKSGELNGLFGKTEQAKPVTGRTRWFVDYSETNKERTTEVKSFATLAEAREFAKGKSGYISKQEDTGNGYQTDKVVNTFKEYFGDFDPSAQEGQKMRAAFGEVPAVKREEGKGEKIDDFGEKIGGARKDTATSTGRTRAKKEEDSSPAWSRRYEISEIARSFKPEEEGKFVINDTKIKDRWGFLRASKQLFDTREEAERAIPLVAVSRNHRVRHRDDVYVIMKDVSDRKAVQVIAQTFQSREDAMRYMAEHATEILEVKTVFGEEIIERPENAARVGAERRTAPATAEDFQKTFGFRGVEFGNWNNQEERQEVMNHAYDGLLDLAEVLGVPPKAISLNGDLALAFGARGQGLSGAKAHYELDYGVINLTKMSGAGSLAHEWFHSVDHYLGRQDGKATAKKITNSRGDSVYDAKSAESDMVSHGFGYKSAVREELRTAFDKAINTMKRKAEKYVEDAVSVEKWIGVTREQLADELAKVRKNLASQLDPKWYKRNNKPASADQLKQFDILVDRLLSGEGVELKYEFNEGGGRSRFGYGYRTNDTLNAMADIYKAVRGRKGFTSDGKGVMDGVAPYLERYLDRIKTYKSAKAGEEKTKSVPTQFMRDSKTLDQGRKGSYFALEHEMAARAFSAYVQDRLTAQQQKSEFLVYGTKTIAPTPWGFVPVFPLGEERIAINEAFDALVKELKTKETDKGVALYEERSGIFGEKTEQSVRVRAGRDNDRRDQDVSQTKARPRSVALGNTGVQRMPAKIKSPGDLAAALKYLTNNAQEHLVAVVLDKNSKPLSIIRHSIGGVGSTNLDSGVLAGAIVSTPDANSVWFVHNHPSDGASLSKKHDIPAAYRLENALRGSGVTSNGIMALTPTEYGTAQGVKQIPNMIADAVSVPVQERVFTSYIESAPDIILESKQDVIDNADAVSGGQDGLALVDNSGRVLGFLAMSGEEMRSLRDGKLPDLLRLIHETNAKGIVGYFQDSNDVYDFYNISAFGNAVQTDALDAVYRIGNEWRSAKEDGLLDPSGSTFFYQAKDIAQAPSPIDLRAAFPWADSIEEVDGKTVITKGKVSFAVEHVESISPDEAAFNIAYGRQFDPKTDQIAGDYRGGTIRISKVGDNWTAKHEHYHFLEDMGLVTKFEQAVLDAAIKKADKAGTLGFTLTTPAENRAYFVQHAMEKRDFQRKTTLGRVLQKVADFVDALVNLVHRTSRGVVRDVESGKMMGRPTAEQRKFMLPMLQAVYHGTVHRGIEKFVLDKIGTGEGSQVFGYGLYFTSRKEIAEWYRDQITAKRNPVQWEASDKAVFHPTRGRWMYQAHPRLSVPGVSPQWFNTKDEADAFIDSQKGQTYKVDIPDDTSMLHWDKTLDAQPTGPKKALTKAIATIRAMGGEIADNPKGNEIYFALEKALGSDKAASESLNALGVVGIKYLDGISRGAGDGTYNFVIFDENAIEILETYYQVVKGLQTKEKSDTGEGMDKRITAYHGTNAESIDNGRLDPKKLGAVTFKNATSAKDAATSLIGFWFNDGAIKESKANPYKNFIAAKLNIKNPIKFGSIKKLSDALGKKVEDLYLDDVEEIKSAVAEWVSAQKKKGYDGIVVSDEEFGGKSYVAFESAQVEITENDTPQYSLATKARELTSDIMHRPEVFGRFKWINTQLHKALRNPAFKRIFDRFHAAAGTQSRSAARAAGLAKDILPDYSGNAAQTVKRLFSKTTDVTREDLRSVSKIMSMETLAGKNASPFAGHRLTDAELASLGRGETVTLGGNDITMTAKQLDLYRQARAALDQMLNEMATSEAWNVMRGVLPEDLRSYWEVFANNPDGVQSAMESMLETELRNASARAEKAERAALSFAGASDMDGFAEHGKLLVKLNKAIDNKSKFSKKQLEDGDLDEIIAKREEKIDRLADELGIIPEDAEENLAEFKRLRKNAIDTKQHVENVKDAQSKIADVFDKSQKLIKAGYAPLSRFGKYRIDVHNDGGNLIHATFYDSSTEAYKAQRKLVADFTDHPDGATVGEVTPVSQEDWTLYQGANPEALRLFAQNAGAESGEAIQAYYQDAVSSRSSLKHLINRKGYAGYSDDLQRIMASFVTSGAKRVSANYHAAELQDMVSDKELAPDLRDEAINLKKFIDNPGDAGSGFRAFAANWYMLGSMMSAVWNGTQVFSSTLPELYKHSGSVARSTNDIGKAYKSIILKHADLTPSEKAALRKAMEDGTVDAAEIHHLYAQASKRFIASLGDGAVAEKAGAVLRLWGMPFAWFETINRKASFLAAYRMAEDQGMDVDEAYEFAKQIVDISQGIYMKHNRPNVARSAAGGAILTFMQYRIMTLEQITRNAKEGGQARKAAALQLAIIMAMGGWAALPLAEDIMDIFDAIMQVVGGKAWLTKKQLREAIEKGSKDAAGFLLEKQAADAVGKVMADFMNIGVVSTILPVNVAGRAGFGNVVPMVKLLKPSTQYRDSEVFDALGVPGSMAQSLMDASSMLLQGDIGRATMRLAPNALAAVAKGVDIAITGEIKNTRGKKVTDGSILDAAIQTVGGQPSRKADINNRLRENQELKYLTQQEERSIVNEWADAYEKKGVVAQSAALKAVRERISDWNRTNPDWPIAVKQSQVMRELQNRRKTTVELAAKSAPKELRKSMAVD